LSNQGFQPLQGKPRQVQQLLQAEGISASVGRQSGAFFGFINGRRVLQRLAA
jgi:hypothetical protein